MEEKDLRPTRLELTLRNVEAFLVEFFDQNPISQVGLIFTNNGIATKAVDLTGECRSAIESSLSSDSNQ